MSDRVDEQAPFSKPPHPLGPPNDAGVDRAGGPNGDASPLDCAQGRGRGSDDRAGSRLGRERDVSADATHVDASGERGGSGSRREKGQRHPHEPRAEHARPASGRAPAARPAANRPAQARHEGAKRRGRGPAIAALDLGTNNCRILIARAEGHGFQVIDAFSRVVRLGEGLAETGRLSEGAMARAVAALSICADRIRKHKVRRFRAIATEACRRASNCDEFLRRVEDATGLELDVIGAEEEARLAVAGCAPLIDPAVEQLLVFDIGGGSTELIRVDLAKAPPAKRKALLMALAHGDSRSERARAAGRHIADWISAPAGVVTLGERFPQVDDRARFEAMTDHVSELIAPFVEQAGFRDAPEDFWERTQLLGASGTITTLAGVHLGLARYERHRVDGLWIAPGDVHAIISRLASMTPAQRAAIPCIGTDRATNLMSGAAILRAILQAAPARRLRVADRGLREGVLYGLAQDGARAARRRRR